jgi:cytochrome c
MINISKLILVGVCPVTALIPLSLTHPFGNPRGVSASSSQLLPGARISEPLRVLVGRKCGNCHSDTVEWPFYARIAPVSWLIERDVSAARAHMNLTRWETYGNQDKEDLLSRLAAKARSGEMPPARYTAIHPDSRLTLDDRVALFDWATAERKRLRREGPHAAAFQSTNSSPAGEQHDLDGKALFEKRCTGCHALDADHEGVRLRGVVGRMAGTIKTFQYSNALQGAGFVWDATRLDKWLTDTDSVVPDNDMAFRVPKQEERAAIITYLKSLSAH